MLLYMKYIMSTEVMWLHFHRFVVAGFVYFKFGDSAITRAAYQGRFDIAELLLKSKVFVLFS
jgi:hypothetical protein